ncbi:hypothetical protein ACP4OV_013170 [Aristida adscensionis]
MDFIVSLVSFLLVFGAVGRGSTNFALAAAVTPSRARIEHWHAVLPQTPMPSAIHDLLIQSAVHGHLNEGTTAHGESHVQRPNFHIHKFVKGPRKIGQHSHMQTRKQSSGEQVQEDIKKATMSYQSRRNGDFYGPQVVENLKMVSTTYGSKDPEDLSYAKASYQKQSKDDLKEVSISYGSANEDLKEVSVKYVSNMEEDSEKNLKLHGSRAIDLKEVSVSYGPESTEKILVPNRLKDSSDLKEVSVSYGSENPNGLKEVSVSYGSENSNDLKEVSVSYGSENTNDLKEVSISYGSENSNDLKEVSVSYGPESSKYLKEVSVSYGQETSKSLKEVSVSYGPESGKDLKEASVSYGSSGEDDQDDIWSGREEDQHKDSISVPQHKNKVTEDEYQQKLSRKIAASKGRSHDEHAVHSHGHPNQRLADVFFFHDAVRPGSVITPTIPTTTSMPPLLPRRVADAIPFSGDRLAAILAMFEPASLAMAGEIRWALDTCEHPRPLPGDRAACATSVESLAEIPAALLGTRDVRAFSGDMPLDRAGAPARRGRYNVTAVRTLSSPSRRVVTCHDLTYPYAVFYCHTASQTAAYAVTLAAVDDAKVEEEAPAATMEVLVVCHLDTSQWSPRNPFFELHNLKPGEVAVCHFLSKLSVIWVPAGEQEGGTREV